MQRSNKNKGFVLVTGLIFLLVITLLALSTMGSATLQEQMASNLREQTRAQEAADAGLRDGENRLARLKKYPVTGENFMYDPTPALGNADDIQWYLWKKDGPIGSEDTSVFLSESLWIDDPDDANDSVATPFGLPFDDTLIAAPQMFIEELQFKPDNLDPESNATALGAAMYRVTSRAQGGKPSAVTVVQSQYAKQY